MKTKKLAKALLNACRVPSNINNPCDLELHLTITVSVVPNLTNKQRLILALKQLVDEHGD